MVRRTVNRRTLLRSTAAGAGAAAPAAAAGDAQAQRRGPAPGPNNPAVLRGTVYAALWPGVSTGAGLPPAARRANLAALQAAVDHAAENGKFFEIEPNTYQIEGGAGLVLGAGKARFRWVGSFGTVIEQFARDAPILTIGELGHTGVPESLVFDGATLRHGVEQAGQRNATGLRFGNLYRSCVDNIYVDAQWDDGVMSWAKPPWYSVLCDSGTDLLFFSNSVRGITAFGAQAGLVRWRTTGTGNAFENWYCANGGGPGKPAVAVADDVAVRLSLGNGQHGNVFNQLNIEWTKANAILRVDSGYNPVFNSVHLEGNRGTGRRPTLVHVVSTNPVFNGLSVLNHYWKVSEGMASGTRGHVFGAWGDVHITANQVTLGGNTDNPAPVDRPWSLFANHREGGLDATASIDGVRFENPHGAFEWDANMPAADFPMPQAPSGTWSVASYRHADLFSEVRNPRIAAAEDITVYGQYRDPVVVYQAALRADRTVTLSKRMRSSSLGSAVPPPVGALATVRREAGRADASRLLVKNHDGALLSTIAAADMTYRYRFDGNNWALVT